MKHHSCHRKPENRSWNLPLLKNNHHIVRKCSKQCCCILYLEEFRGLLFNFHVKLLMFHTFYFSLQFYPQTRMFWGRILTFISLLEWTNVTIFPSEQIYVFVSFWFCSNKASETTRGEWQDWKKMQSRGTNGGEKWKDREGCGAAAVNLSACFILAGFCSVLFVFGLFLLCAPTLVTDEWVHMKVKFQLSEIPSWVWMREEENNINRVKSAEEAAASWSLCMR